VPALDRTIHEPARLAIASLLYVVDSADFVFVRQQIGLTPGNLSAHLSKLESEGYLDVQKRFEGRRPVTTLRLTKRGRRTFEKYVSEMKAFLQRVASSP